MITTSFRFSKRSRLHTPAEFSNVFSKPHKFHGTGFTLLFSKNTCGYPRLGLAISRKVAAQAAVRNRLKRVVRESFRINQAKLDSFDVVFLGKSPLSKVPNDALFDALTNAWSKLGNQCAK